jgi:hypothetical protein
MREWLIIVQKWEVVRIGIGGPWTRLRLSV